MKIELWVSALVTALGILCTFGGGMALSFYSSLGEILFAVMLAISGMYISTHGLTNLRTILEP